MQFNLFDYRETKYCIKFLKKIPALALSCDKQKLAQLIPCELSFSLTKEVQFNEFFFQLLADSLR